MSLISITVQNVTCKVEVRYSRKVFYATCLYGFNDREPRMELWRDLEVAHRTIGDVSWIVMGDFNIVRHPSERTGGNPADLNEIADFNECINNTQLIEMVTRGQFFT